MPTPPKARPERPVAPDRYEGFRGLQSYPGMAAYEIEKAVPGSVEPELAGRGESIPKVGEPPPSGTLSPEERAVRSGHTGSAPRISDVRPPRKAQVVSHGREAFQEGSYESGNGS